MDLDDASLVGRGGCMQVGWSFFFAATLDSGVRFMVTEKPMESASIGVFLLACAFIFIYKTKVKQFACPQHF